MSPLDLLLYSLATTPAIIITGLVVNLVANNVSETRATARQWPRLRTATPRKARR